MNTLYRPTSQLAPYGDRRAFAGDLHNHCGISYGHGTLDEAYRNARLQLDFVSVTGHAAWPDMPEEPAFVAEYHREGFARLRSLWPEVCEAVDAHHEPGEFVTFPSFEWHSSAYGDHCVYVAEPPLDLDLSNAPDLPALRERLAALGRPAIAIPHHIGYQSGRRGITWNEYTEEFSPVLELVSMHGNGEATDAPRPYLHTMGPRDPHSVAAHGLSLGHHVGFIGSTDHHSAHPGSYGYGRAMVWAEELSRTSIFDAILARRTYAVTGDRIMLAVAAGDAPMGSVVDYTPGLTIDVDIVAQAPIEVVELVRNGKVVARRTPDASPPSPDGAPFDGLVTLALGWGEVHRDHEWRDVAFEVEGATVTAHEPKFRGDDVLEPDREGNTFAFSSWAPTDHGAVLHTRTNGNPTIMMDTTQRFTLHVEANADARVAVRGEGWAVERPLRELMRGDHVHYVGGFISPALVLERALPRDEVSLRWEIPVERPENEDHYYVRVRQTNGQFAWSSPIWIR